MRLRFESLQSGKVGHYGCSAGGGRVVRVGLAGEGKPPTKSVEIDCPNCGNRHEASITWRSPTPLDEGWEPEVVVEAEGQVTDAPRPAWAR